LNEFFWLRIETAGEHGNELSGSMKGGKFSGLAK
jgi:hypothetical protein